MDVDGLPLMASGSRVVLVTPVGLPLIVSISVASYPLVFKDST